MIRLAAHGVLTAWLLVALAPVMAAADGEADRQAAERLLDRVIAQQRAQQTRDRAEADRLVNAAVEFFKQGHYTNARETLERALRLDAGNAAGLELKAALDRKLAADAPQPVISPPAPAPGDVERQLQVALIEGHRLIDEGQPHAAVEVLENAERAIALAPGGLNLAPYAAETGLYLAKAKAAAGQTGPARPGAADGEAASADALYLRSSKVPTVFNPEGTRRRGELTPIPDPVDRDDERRMITRDRARYWALPSTYHEEYDFAAAELAVRPIGPPPLLRLPADWKEKSERRLAQARGEEPWERDLRAKLAGRIDGAINFDKAPLTDVLSFLKDLTGISIVLDASVTTAGLDKRQISLEVSRVKLESVFNLVAELSGTAYVLRDEVVLFTTPEKARTYKVTRIYHIGDLTQPMINWVEWHPLRPPQKWEADPWWDRYLDYYERWGGWGGYGAGYPPPFWPPKYMEGQTREERTMRIYEMIDRVLGTARE